METPVRNTSADATGVSRSGRVRKKSSKLADFESPDEIDTRFKRKTDRPQKSPKIMKVGLSMGADVFDDSDSYIDDDLIEVKDEPLEVDDWVDNDDGDDDMCDDGDDRDDTNDALHVDDDSTDMPRETSNYSLAQSLYFSEKQGKKNIMLKDGQVVRRKKAQRKDKGKSRFTAYMLWAREIRPGIIQANPNMDFSAVNKRLGELWALVPTTQKYNWKRRAKRLAAKGNQKGSMISTGKAAKQSQNAARSNLINKGGVKPQQVIRTPSKQSEVGQSAPATTHKAHTTTPKSVTVHEVYGEEEEAGDIVISILDNEIEGPQETEISSQVTAWSIDRNEDLEHPESSFTKLTEEVGEPEPETKRTLIVVRTGGRKFPETTIPLPRGGVILNVLKFVKKDLPLIINEIFREMKIRYSDCCPEILEAALRNLLAQQVTLPQASEFYCMSVERLQRNVEILNRLKNRTSPQMFYSSLKRIMHTNYSDKFFEWMLRMRKIGRLPVLNDIHMIKQYLDLSCYPKGVEEFLRKFGEKLLRSGAWRTMTNYSVWRWTMMFRKYLFNHYGIVASRFMVKENASRIFNCVELFLSFTCIRNHVIIYRGNRNAYSFVCPKTSGINVMVTFSAAGVYLKPLFLQKGYGTPAWNDPEFIDQSQFHTAASKTGMLEPLLFLTWLRLFNNELVEQRIEKPVLLLVHGHPCHASLAAFTFCQEEGIILFSHYHTPFNPLDPFSRMLSKFHSNYKRSLNVLENYIGKANLSEKCFPVIFLDAWKKMEDDLAIKAFKESGLIPFNMPVVPLFSKDKIWQSMNSIEVPYPLKLCHGTKPCISRSTFERVPQVELPYEWEILTVPESSVNSPDLLVANDPLEVYFEPLLHGDNGHKNIVHVFGKPKLDEQPVILDNDNSLTEVRVKEEDDLTTECKHDIVVMNQDINPGLSGSTLPTAPENTSKATVKTPVDISDNKIVHISCEDNLHSEFYKSQGPCDVKIESSSEEIIESDGDEFPCIYIKCESPRVEDVS
nr:uncharacterized protein LOC123765280 isoform X2 [Procambarus clarkii]